MKKLSIFIFVVLVVLLIFVIPETNHGFESNIIYKSTSLRAKEMMLSFFIPAICLLILGLLVLKN